MSTKIKARDLKAGQVILDGIASRIDSVTYHADIDEAYVILTDGNGYGDTIRLSGEAEVIHFEDWTDEDWQAFLEL